MTGNKSRGVSWSPVCERAREGVSGENGTEVSGYGERERERYIERERERERGEGDGER